MLQTHQISHMVLHRYVKQCPVFFFAKVCFAFEREHMKKIVFLVTSVHVRKDNDFT